MQVRESRFFNFLPEIIQCFPCSLRISSEALHQLVNTENRENGLAVNLKIIRLLEILIDHPVNDNLKIIFINNSVPQNRRIVLIFVNIPIIALYIVIGPHDIKLHLRVIFCFQESIVQRTFQKWSLVIDGDLPLCIHAHRSDDIATAIRIAEEFDLAYTIEHCTEGHLIAPFLAEKKVRAAIGPTLSAKTKLELRNKTWETPVALWRAGVHFCIITDHPVIPIEHLSVCLSLAVRAGLPRDEALRAVTLSAAEHLGIERRLGSIEKDKDADLVLWDGDPLDARSHVVRTMIDGEVVYSRE